MIENYTRLSSRIFTATVVGKDQKGRKITEGVETYKTPSGVYEIKDWARHVEKAAECLTGHAYEHWEGFTVPVNTQADETGQLTFRF